MLYPRLEFAECGVVWRPAPIVARYITARSSTSVEHRRLDRIVRHTGMATTRLYPQRQARRTQYCWCLLVPGAAYITTPHWGIKSYVTEMPFDHWSIRRNACATMMSVGAWHRYHFFCQFPASTLR